MRVFKRRRKPIIVNLVGGLGNQLFCYFAGLHLAYHTSRELKISCQNIDRKHTDGNFNLSSFAVQGEFIPSSGRIYRQFRRIPIALSVRVRFVVKKIAPWKVTKGAIPENYDSYSAVLPKFKELGVKLQVKGFYQDFRFVSNLPQSFQNIILRDPSSEFVRDLHYLEENAVLSLHMRLGDFLQGNNPHAIGNLDPNWYLNALNYAFTRENYSYIWVFSNDADAAREFLHLDTNLKVRFFGSGFDRDPAEDLMLMAHSTCLIAANSTFSLWSAYMGKKDKLVIYPQPFTRNGTNEINGIPDSWISLSSIWTAP